MYKWILHNVAPVTSFQVQLCSSAVPLRVAGPLHIVLNPQGGKPIAKKDNLLYYFNAEFQKMNQTFQTCWIKLMGCLHQSLLAVSFTSVSFF